MENISSLPTLCDSRKFFPRKSDFPKPYSRCVCKHNQNTENLLSTHGISRSGGNVRAWRWITDNAGCMPSGKTFHFRVGLLCAALDCSKSTANAILKTFRDAGLIRKVREGSLWCHLAATYVVSPEVALWGQFVEKQSVSGRKSGPVCVLKNKRNNPPLPLPEGQTAEEREGENALNDEMPKDDELEAPAGVVDSAIQSTENDSLILDCGEHHEAQAEPEAQAHQEAPGSPRHRPEVPRATPAPRNRQEYSREEKFRRESRQQSAKDRFYRRRCQGKPQASAYLGHPAAKVEVKLRASEALFRLGEILAGLSVPLVAAGEVARRLSGKAEASILDLCTGLERLAADGSEFDPLAFCRSVAEEYPRFLRWRQAMGEAWAAGWLRLKVLRGRLEACGVRCVDWALDQLSGWALVEFPNLEEILARFPDWTEGQTSLRNPGGFLAKLCGSPERFREWLPRLEVILKPGLDPREVRKAEARALRVSEEEKLRQENDAAWREADEGREKYPLAYLAHRHNENLTIENKSRYQEMREAIKNSFWINFPCYVGLG